ncbi:putative ANP1 protein [Dactylonectria macrodidyma]|uniref:ANP1 protein n=1 Tax=Dactylonectria macrodidyma TaxID=307937 RepID=A0A9P9EY39_9HYPO|nr:putative ANP1 protein [Dactylonectria macrodidyma]
MLLPQGGLNWKATKAKLPLSRFLRNNVTRSRFFPLVVAVCVFLLLWRGLFGSAPAPQSWGPGKSPMDMTPNEYAVWNSHMKTPVIFNHHAPIEVGATSIQHIDLNPIKSTRRALANEERILILTPLKDASSFLPRYFQLLSQITYPHRLIDIAFLISDSTDDTLAILASELDRLQRQPGEMPFRSAMVIEKDFNFHLSQDVNERHSFEAQGPRRKAMGKARNYLLATALKPEHSWVYWRDVDIVDCPGRILEDFIAHDKDIIVPNIWFHRIEKGVDIEGRFDYNSWIETDKGRKLVSTLPKDVVLAEGYHQYDTGRKYLAKMGDWRENKDVEVELDGIGGVNIVVKADVHRSGINFPCYAFENQAETEGFAKMAKRAGYQVVGLPNYIVWHIDTDEKGGNK